MIGYIIAGAAAVLLAVLLFLPVRVLASYDRGEVSVKAAAASFSVPLYPRPPKEEQEKPPAAEEKKDKPPRKKLSVNMDQILYSLEKLPPILGRALKGLGRRIRIAPLKVHILVAQSDPADTAVLYGRLMAAFESAMPVLHRVMHISGQDIQLFPDFQEEKPDFIAEVGISIRLWDVLVIALRAGFSLLGWFLGFRRLADKPSAVQKEKSPSGAEAA